MRIKASSGKDPMTCCNCIKTDPQSGQARRGKHCALRPVIYLFFRACARPCRAQGVGQGSEAAARRVGALAGAGEGA